MALADYIDFKPVIDTARLRIRPMSRDDVPDLKEWMPDPALYAYWGKGPGKADKDPERLFERPGKPAKSFHLGIEETDAGKVIGDLWVYKIENDRMATVAIRIAPACQGKGYGTEALAAMTRFCFENTELQRLWTGVDVRNTASRHVLEKCGYQKEGLIRQGKLVNTWCDYYIYGMLRSDLAEAVSRVRQMEMLFDQLSDALEREPERIGTEEALQKAAGTLSAYLDEGTWMQDYQMDELGMLPADLKRGVLSQDGLYDLLCDPGIEALIAQKNGK